MPYSIMYVSVWLSNSGAFETSVQVKLKEVNIARAPATNKGPLCYDSQRHGNGQINKNNFVIVLPDTLDLFFFNLKEKHNKA